MSQRNVVLVVTPTRNAERYVEETILSVVQQRGDFDIYYHVQDGGSTDSTAAIARSWIDRLHAMDGRFFGGPRIHMSFDSAPDGSMYEAIQSGFERLLRESGPLEDRRVAMTWINADDVLAVNAVRIATDFLFEKPDRSWVTGIPSVIIEDGSIADIRDAPYGYSRPHLALGMYDGRSRLFFQQEGTFWTDSLWSTVGGLNRQLTLAGDWDLWRRMAAHAGVATVRTVLAHHRRCQGQLTAEMEGYWKEVDSIRALAGLSEQPPFDGEDVGLVARSNSERNGWAVDRVDLTPAQAVAIESREHHSGNGIRIDFSVTPLPEWVSSVSGLSDAEHWGRWSDARWAPSVRICCRGALANQVLLRLRLAVFHPDCNPVVVMIGPRRWEIHASTTPTDYSCEVTLDRPANVIDIRPAAWFCPKDLGASSDDRRLGVALRTLNIVAASAST